MIQERIAALRSLMAERHIDAYMIPTSDFHESEYVGDYFKCRKFITGFTGSAGTADYHADRGETLDRRAVFRTGGEAAGGNRRDPYEIWSGGRTDRGRVSDRGDA